MDEELLSLSQRLGELLRGKGLKIKTAESFTGGAVSSAIIMTEGASEYFDEGIVCYSLESKMQRLNVKEENLSVFGAVSLPVLRNMLQGLINSGADIAAATTGNAGPSAQNGTVGECYIGVASRYRMVIKKLIFKNPLRQALSAIPERLGENLFQDGGGDAMSRREIIQNGAKETLRSIIKLITN